MMKQLVTCFAVCLTLSLWPLAANSASFPPINGDPYVSALVVDSNTGQVLFEDNADAKVYPASVLKLMTLYVILDRMEQGLLKPDEMVQVTKEAYKTGGSQVYLDPREQFPVDDLMYALMVQSANDAAVALATHIAGSKEGFVALMNEKAKALGMNASHFHSVHGLPPGKGQQPDETTARDIATLSRALVKKPDAIKYTSTQTKGFREDKFIMRNHNKLLTSFPGCDGLKTGYFQAGGFSIAATAKRGDVRIIAVVMGSKNRKVRDAKARELLSKGFLKAPAPPKTPAAPATSPTAMQIDASTPATGAKTSVAPAAMEKPADNKPQKPLEQPLPPTSTTSGSGWGKFFLGIALGFGLFLGFFIVAGFLMKKKNKNTIRRYRRR